MTPRVDKYRLLRLVDSRLTAIGKMATIVVAFLLVLGMPACSNEDGVGESDNTVVTLSISTADAADTQTKGSTRADADDSSNKDYYVGDLTVYIFDSNGDVIGSVYGGPSINSQMTYTGKTINVSITTRKATGCTVYAVANAGTKASPNEFVGITRKADFDEKYHQLTTENNLNGTTSDGNPLPLIMFGELRGFNTTATKSPEIPLKRLASKFDFTIKVDKDQGDAEDKWPIVIDSYQLKSVPMASYYVLPFWGDGTWNGKGDRDIPTGANPQYGDYNAVTVGTTSTTSVAYTVTYYMYGNNAGEMTEKGKAPGKATYLEIKAHAQVSETDPTKVWESTYKVYLGGDNTNSSLTPGTPVASDGTSGTYNGNFTVYPNVHYNITINIYGSGHSENGGLRVTYQAKPYFSSDGLDKWTDKDEDLDVKARSKSSGGS